MFVQIPGRGRAPGARGDAPMGGDALKTFKTKGFSEIREFNPEGKNKCFLIIFKNIFKHFCGAPPPPAREKFGYW